MNCSDRKHGAHNCTQLRSQRPCTWAWDHKNPGSKHSHVWGVFLLQALLHADASAGVDRDEARLQQPVVVCAESSVAVCQVTAEGTRASTAGP